MKKKNKINSVGFIIDGNRRWAVENGISKLEGHRYGMETVKKAIKWSQEMDIKNLVFYVFSTENWNRVKIEVETLLALFSEFLEKEIDAFFVPNDLAVKFIGSRDRFSSRIQKLMDRAEDRTKNNKTNVFLAVSYGGRLEITEAIKKLSRELSKQDIEKLTEKDFEKFLWSQELPDPEIIIRTGGHARLSNFLTWKSVYSELFFTDTKWPAFSKDEFFEIIKIFQEKVKINNGK